MPSGHTSNWPHGHCCTLVLPICMGCLLIIDPREGLTSCTLCLHLCWQQSDKHKQAANRYDQGVMCEWVSGPLPALIMKACCGSAGLHAVKHGSNTEGAAGCGRPGSGMRDRLLACCGRGVVICRDAAPVTSADLHQLSFGLRGCASGVIPVNSTVVSVHVDIHQRMNLCSGPVQQFAPSDLDKIKAI